jgi:hypothetical protein
MKLKNGRFEADLGGHILKIGLDIIPSTLRSRMQKLEIKKP